MRLILTYHEVRDTGNEKCDFYTISPAQLDGQLAILIAQGRQSGRIEELPNGLPEDRFILTFDDGTADHFAVVLPILEKHRCHASFFIPTAKLDQPGYLTRAQVKAMAAAGHGIGSHSHEHQRMDILPEEEIRRQIARSQEILAEITGAKPFTFVPPGGYTNERVRSAAAALGMRALRTMRWGHNQKLDLMALETVPINHYTDDKKFIKLLLPGGTSLLYTGKETLKRLVPIRSYEWLRRMVFKFRKS